MSDLPYRARAFGQYWASDVLLAHFDTANGNETATDFTVRRVEQLPDRVVIKSKGRGEIFEDGFRFHWTDVATFDFQASRLISYLPQANWRDAMPDAFFSTVTALAVASVGMLPMHASAIEFEGRAYLFAGSAGEGKSTITAELLAHGARLLSDDLTVLSPPDGESGFMVTRGRPAMRLHPATAALVDSESCEQLPDDERGKLLVRPARRADNADYPLAGIFLLGAGLAEVTVAETLGCLPLQIFRPRWMNAMPGHGQRLAWLIELAGKIPVRRLAAIEGFDGGARRCRIQTALLGMAG